MSQIDGRVIVFVRKVTIMSSVIARSDDRTARHVMLIFRLYRCVTISETFGKKYAHSVQNQISQPLRAFSDLQLYLLHSPRPKTTTNANSICLNVSTNVSAQLKVVLLTESLYNVFTQRMRANFLPIWKTFKTMLHFCSLSVKLRP